MSKLIKKPESRQLIKTPQELVHIKHKITLRQYKYWLLMLRAYREAYEAKGDTNEQGFHRLPIAVLEEWLGYELVRGELRADLEAVRREPIIYNVLGKDGKKVLRGAGFISEWELTANWIGFKLPDFLKESIEQLDLKSSIFQKINWDVFNSFTGKYEAILYKLCRDYVGSKRTPTISIDNYREYMGLKPGEYAEFKDLNKITISAPVKRINESAASDITVEAVFTRQGRKVVAVQFLVSLKHQTMLDLGDDPAFRFARVTIALAKQREYIEAKGAEMVELSIQRANEYGEEQENLGKEVNFGALYRKAIEEDWGQEYKAKQARKEEQAKVKVAKGKAEQTEAQKKRIAELETEFRITRIKEARNALTLQDREAHARAWLETPEGRGKEGLYDAAKGGFKDSMTNIQFVNVYLPKVLAKPYEPSDFIAWVREAKKLDPVKLGLTS